MDSLSFLEDAPKSEHPITIQVNSPNGPLIIHNVNPDYLEALAPELLARMVYEDDGARLTFDQQESKAAVISLLRFIYLNDYRLSEALIDQPCSSLFHLQMFKIGQLYGLDLLMDQARRYLLCELEYACSNSKPAIDICSAIRFLYLELDDEDDLKDTVANYCVENFKYHKLVEYEAFCQTVYEAPEFHRLLCRVNFNNGFSAEGASDILQMKTCTFAAHSGSKEVQRAANFLCHMHTYGFEREIIQREPEPWSEPSRSNSFVLVERPPPIIPFDGEEEKEQPPAYSEKPQFSLPYRQADPSVDPNWGMLPRAEAPRPFDLNAPGPSMHGWDLFGNAKNSDFHRAAAPDVNNWNWFDDSKGREQQDSPTIPPTCDSNSPPVVNEQEWALVDVNDSDTKPLLQPAPPAANDIPVPPDSQRSTQRSIDDDDWDMFNMEDLGAPV